MEAAFGSTRPRGRRTSIPASFRYLPAVSRRTPVASWMRRSGHPSRPSAKTCCRFVSLKTLLIRWRRQWRRRAVNVPAQIRLAGFQVSITGRFWVSTEGRTSYGSRI